MDLRTSSYESLLAASALFEVKCSDERKAFCDCKRKYMDPKKCLAQANNLAEAHNAQYDMNWADAS